MDLDEEDYENLGFGGQKAYEVLAKDMEHARAAYTVYMREYMRQYRINNRAKLNANKRITQAEWVKTDKGKAYILSYRSTDKYRTATKERKKKYLKSLKTDPVKYEKFLIKQRAKDKRRRDKKRKEKLGSTTTKT